MKEKQKTIKIAIKKMYLEKSERLSGYTQLIVETENGDEYIISGDYCGGIPVSSWHKIKKIKNDG